MMKKNQGSKFYCYCNFQEEVYSEKELVENELLVKKLVNKGLTVSRTTVCRSYIHVQLKY
jgi:hypothetical protein